MPGNKSISLFHLRGDIKSFPGTVKVKWCCVYTTNVWDWVTFFFFIKEQMSKVPRCTVIMISSTEYDEHFNLHSVSNLTEWWKPPSPTDWDAIIYGGVSRRCYCSVSPNRLLSICRTPCLQYVYTYISVSHQHFIFIPNGKLFMDKRYLSLCLSQISLETLQELQALTELNQCLEGWLTLVLSERGVGLPACIWQLSF